MIEVERHIWYNPEDTENADGEWLKGYYFADEAEGLNGPYDSQEKARDALTRYVEYTFTPHEAT